MSGADSDLHSAAEGKLSLSWDRPPGRPGTRGQAVHELRSCVHRPLSGRANSSESLLTYVQDRNPNSSPPHDVLGAPVAFQAPAPSTETARPVSAWGADVPVPSIHPWGPWEGGGLGRERTEAAPGSQVQPLTAQET